MADTDLACTFLLDVVKIIRSEIPPAHIAMPLWSFRALSLMGKRGPEQHFLYYEYRTAMGTGVGRNGVRGGHHWAFLPLP